MAISTQPMTFVRFSIDTPSADFWDNFDETVLHSVFVPTENSISSGLVSWNDAFKTSFSYSEYQKGEYIAFQFRVDEKKVPANVKKQYMDKEIKRYINENSGRTPPRDVRREMSERADEVLLQQAFPVPSFCEMVWSSNQRVMYAGSTNKKMLERLMLFLEDNFQLQPIAIPDIELAKVLFENTSYIVTINTLQTEGSSVWLGFEFLTWLWYVLDNSLLENITFQDKPVTAALLDRISLTLPADTKEKVLVITSDTSSLREARTALLEGKRVYEMSLVVIVGESEYNLTIDYNVWPFKTVKTPKTDGNNAPEETDSKFFEKMYFVEEICGAIDAIYKNFLTKRLDQDWNTIRTDMTNWIESYV